MKERRIINAAQTKRVVSDCTVRVSATREERANQSSQGTEQSLIGAIGVRNDSDAILHKRPACVHQSHERLVRFVWGSLRRKHEPQGQGV